MAAGFAAPLDGSIVARGWRLPSLSVFTVRTTTNAGAPLFAVSKRGDFRLLASVLTLNQILHLQTHSPAVPIIMELFLHKLRVVVAALSLKRFMQSE